MGIGENLIYRWKSKQRQVPSLPGKSGQVADVWQEGEQLREKLRQTELERDILKKPWPSRPDHFQSWRGSASDLKLIYRFIGQFESEFPVNRMCKIFKVSRSAYYEWKTGQNDQPSLQEEVHLKGKTGFLAA
jgi:hypothetical protein